MFHFHFLSISYFFSFLAVKSIMNSLLIFYVISIFFWQKLIHTNSVNYFKSNWRWWLFFWLVKSDEKLEIQRKKIMFPSKIYRSQYIEYCERERKRDGLIVRNNKIGNHKICEKKALTQSETRREKKKEKKKNIQRKPN